MALTLIRSDTEASIVVEGVVRRQVRTAELSGVGVEFTGMTEAKREELFLFISESIPLIEDADLVEEGDPKLA